MRRIHVWISGLALLFLLASLGSCGGGYSSGGSSQPPPPPPPPGNAIHVTVTTSQTFQTWEAWETGVAGPYFFVANNPSTLISPTIMSNMLDDLANDLNITTLQQAEPHAKQQAWTTDYTGSTTTVNWSFIDFSKTYTVGTGEATIDLVKLYDQVINPFFTRVTANGWTPKLVLNPFMAKGAIPAFLQTDANKYATMMQAMTLWLQGNTTLAHPAVAVTPSRFTVTNEPDASGGRSASEVNTFASALQSRFSMMGVATKLQLPELWSCNSSFATTAVAGLTSVAVISTHAYDYQSTTQPTAAEFTCRNNLRALAAGISATTAMTEMCCWSNWTTNELAAVAQARDIYWDMTEMNISTLLQSGAMWNPPGTASCAGGVRGTLLALANDLSSYYKCAQYYALRQYSHWIHPGYVRIGTSCTGCTTDPYYGQTVKPVAFQSPGGKVVVVIINDQAGSQSITVSGLPAGTYDITGVDPNNSTTPVTYPPVTITAGQTITVPFPGQAILTYAQR